jgi:hypothetical protein
LILTIFFLISVTVAVLFLHVSLNYDLTVYHS